MKVAHFPNQISTHKTTLVLGAFEAIHNGHLELIKAAQKEGHRVAVMIIENPSALPGASKEEFASLDIRLEHLAWLGVEFVSVVKFNEDIRLMDGKEFIKQIMKSVNAESLVMGSDFACGRGGEYKAKDIANDFKDSKIIDILKINDKKISTSILREMITLGHVDTIRQLAPFAYEVKANVDSKGFFEIKNQPKLHAGIYAATAEINDILYWACVYVNQAGVMNIQVPDLQIKNSPFNGNIAFLKLVRVIVSSAKDKFEKDDLAKVANYLKNNI